MKQSCQNNALAIDMGERYLLAIVSNLPGQHPILIPNTLERGRIKKISAKAKKDPFSVHEELYELNSYLQTRCHYVIGECLRLGIRSIALGNRSIKNPYKIRYKSLRDNPYLNITLHLVNTLRFECSLARVEVHMVDEAFTSQIDALALEEIEYSGTKRWRRRSQPGHLRGKSYLSSSGEIIDRDINAAINIGRIVYGNIFADNIIRDKLWDRPVIPRFEEKKTKRIPTRLWPAIPAGYASYLCTDIEEGSGLGSGTYVIN
jgi:transposase